MNVRRFTVLPLVRVALLGTLLGTVGACDDDDAAGVGARSGAGSAGVPVVPDAVVDVAFADAAAFVDVVGRFARAGLLPAETRVLTQSSLEAAGIAAPIVVAVRGPAGGGDVVVAARLLDVTRFQAALALSLPKGLRIERRFGAVDAIVEDGSGSVVALVRARDGVVVVVGRPADPLAAATLVEALGSGTLSAPRRAPAPGEARLTAGPALLQQTGTDVTGVTGTVRVDGDDVVVALDVGVAGELSAMTQALSTTAPPFACAVEDGAALSVRLPPALGESGAHALGGLVDASDLDVFSGRVLLALHEVAPGTVVDADDKATWASLVVGGQPRAGGAASLRQALADSGRTTATRSVGTRRVQDLEVPGKPWRRVSAVVDDDVFALSIGAPVVVDRVAVAGSCPSSTSSRLLVLDGPKLLGIVARASPELALLRSLQGLAAGAGALAGGGAGGGSALADGAFLPGGLRALQATERLEVSAVPRNGAVDVTIRLRLLRR